MSVSTSMRRIASATYGSALRTVYGGVGFPWQVHDEVVRIDPDARHLVPHASEPALFRHLKATVRPGDVVLDVGAFVGIYAVLEARWAGESGRLVAFEPTASSAALARRHFAWNGDATRRIELIEAAVADRPGRAVLHEYDAHGLPYVNSLARAVDTDRPARTREVPVVTIDDVCRERRIVPSVIRMDVQGAELQALLGARETIHAASRLSIVVEMHPQCWPEFGVSEADVRQAIEDLGLAARPLAPEEGLFGRDTHAVLSWKTSVRA
jgi:FkbM family methyltransferase